MSIYKPLLTLTAYPWYAADVRFGIACSLLGAGLAFLLSRRKGLNAWVFALLGALAWGYAILAIGFFKSKKSIGSHVAVEPPGDAAS